MISTNWKATAATAVVLALSVMFVACQNAAAPISETAQATATEARTPTATSEPAQDQSTWTNPIDGAIYVRVPAGPFLMGSTDDDTLARGSEKPQHTVTLEEFWIKRTEVTNAEYAKCVEAGACIEPENTIWDDADYGNYPVTHVTWHQAKSYADWAEGRLCSEAEWEKACRGTEGRIYPWGDSTPSAATLNYNGHVGGSSPAGAYSPAGDSPYGVADMAGNVWEWTSSLFEPYPYIPTDGREDLQADGGRGLRGGAFFDGESRVRCAARFALSPRYLGDALYGFRVCASPGLSTTGLRPSGTP